MRVNNIAWEELRLFSLNKLICNQTQDDDDDTLPFGKEKKHQKNFFCQQCKEVCVEQVVRAAGVQSPAPKLMAAARKSKGTHVFTRGHTNSALGSVVTLDTYMKVSVFPTFGSYQKMKPHTFVFESN